MSNIDALMRLSPVIPVLVIEDPARAQPLARALVAKGHPLLEVTLRTPAALEVIAEMARVEGAIVGAGTGLDLPLLCPGLQLTAVDLTPAMIRRLTKRAARLELPIDARVMDAHELEFADGSFDVVILHLILAVVPDPVKCNTL